MPSNLIAYIPVLNRRHLTWFVRHKPVDQLLLISQKMAEILVPRLSRNIVAVPTMVTYRFVQTIYHISHAHIFYLNNGSCQLSGRSWILPDEDVSRAFAERYLLPHEISCEFEQIWARYDMTAVKRQSPVMPDVTLSSKDLHRRRMVLAEEIAKTTPDWWRQIAAAIFSKGKCVATACNNHYPTEYVTDILGDPRMNVDAGQVGKYVSLHAELATLVYCAKNGISTSGASMYVTVFPCENCARAIVSSGIKELFFVEGYSALDALEVLKGAGVRIVQVV